MARAFAATILWLAVTSVYAAPIDPIDPPEEEAVPQVSLAFRGLPGYEQGIPQNGTAAVYTIGPPQQLAFSAVADDPENRLTRLVIEWMRETECEPLPGQPLDGPFGVTVPWTTAATATSYWGTAMLAAQYATQTPTAPECIAVVNGWTVLGRAKSVQTSYRAVAYRGASEFGSQVFRFNHTFILRVMTWNVANAKWKCSNNPAGYCVPSLEDTLADGTLANVIREKRADVVGLQEVRFYGEFSRPRRLCAWWDQGAEVDQTQVIANQLGMYSQTEENLRADPSVYAGHNHKENIILSRIPLSKSQSRATAIVPDYCHNRLNPGDWWYKERNGIAVVTRAVLDFSGRKLAVYNSHLQVVGWSKGLDSACTDDVLRKTRRDQANFQAALMESNFSADRIPFLGLGDLNADWNDEGLGDMSHLYCPSSVAAVEEGSTAQFAASNEIDFVFYPHRTIYPCTGDTACQDPTGTACGKKLWCKACGDGRQFFSTLSSIERGYGNYCSSVTSREGLRGRDPADHDPVTVSIGFEGSLAWQ